MSFNAKAIHVLEKYRCYLTYSKGIREVRTFPMSISPKVNALARLEFEIVYYDLAVQHIGRCTTVSNEKNTQHLIKLKNKH